jgi:hypothetical protein
MCVSAHNVSSEHVTLPYAVTTDLCRSSCSVAYCLPILTETGMCHQILVKVPNTAFHKTVRRLSHGGRRTDRHFVKLVAPFIQL